MRMAFLAAALALVAGCKTAPKNEVPKTYPAGGKVIGEDGRPMTAGTVEFSAPDKPNVTTNGAIGEDGSFQLFTIVGDERVEGAAPGTYTARIVPVQAQSHEKLSARQTRSIDLPGTYTVKEGGPNEFTLRVPATP